METQARNSVLRRGRRLAVATALLGAWLVQSGCGGHATVHEPGPKSARTLADVLEPMPPRAQLDTLRTLERHDSTNSIFPFHAGNAYYQLATSLPTGQHDRAVALLDSAVTSYQRAIALDSTYSRAYVNMGLAYDAATKPAQARAAYRHAIAVNPRDVLAYCHLGYMEEQAGNTAGGVELYEKALAIDPKSAQAHYNLGLAFAQARVFKEALTEWDQVVQLDPGGDLGKSAAENVKIIRQYLGKTP